MISMVSKEARKQTNKGKSKQKVVSTGTNVDLDPMSIASLY